LAHPINACQAIDFSIAYLLAMLSDFWSPGWHKFSISHFSLCHRLLIEKQTLAATDDTKALSKDTGLLQLFPSLHFEISFAALLLC